MGQKDRGNSITRRNVVAIVINRRLQNVVLRCNLKNDRMISVHFQGKPFNIMVTQVYALKSNTEEAKVEWFCEDLQDLLELKPRKRCPFHYMGLEWGNLTQMTIVSTTVGRNPLEEME